MIKKKKQKNEKKLKKVVDKRNKLRYTKQVAERYDKATKQNEEKLLHYITGCGSAWLERLLWEQEVAGSNPVTPI